MKRILGLFILLGALAGLTGCGGGYGSGPWSQPTSQAPAGAAPGGILPGAQAQAATVPAPGAAMPSVKVALLLPLSGQTAALGQSMLQAAQLAVFDMGDRSFELMPRDTGATPEGARAAAESAIGAGAQLLIGPLFSAEVRAVKPVAATRNVSMVAFSTDWTQAGGNTFVMGFLPFSQVQRIVEYAAAKGYRRIGVIAPDTDYGNAVVNYYSAVISRTGLQPGPVLRISSGQADLQARIAAFAQGQPGPDAVLMAVGGDQAASIAALLTANGMGPDKVKRLGTGLWDDSPLARDPNMQGAWYAAPQPDLRRPFEQKYAASYGQPAPRLSTLAYDATALAAVLARTGYMAAGRPAFDRASISNPNGFSGIDGILRFQSDGLADRGMAVMEMNGGAVSVIAPAPRTFQKSVN